MISPNFAPLPFIYLFLAFLFLFFTLVYSPPLIC